MYDVAIGADRRHHVDAVQFLQAAAIEGLLHGKARAQQPDAANVFFPHLQRRGIGDVNQRQAAGLLDRLRHLVHGVGADHDSFGAGGAQSHCGGGQQPAGAVPIALVLQAFNLLKIDAVEHDFGRVQPAEARLYLLVDGAVIRNGGFPAHATQQAQHFHHSFLSISDDPLTLPENRRADDALFGA